MDGHSNTSNLDTIPKRLKFIAETFPDREIFICVGKDSRDAFTAGRLLELAGKFAARLLRHGFKKGDVLANTLPNSPERIITDLGIVLAGCIGLNGQVLLADGSDFLGTAWKSRCNGVILCPEQWSAAWKLLQPHITQSMTGMFVGVTRDQVPDLKTAVVIRSRYSEKSGDQRPFLEDLELSLETAPDLDLCQPDDVMYVLSSSGSSGFSKLIPHTHRETIAIGSPNQLTASSPDTAKEFSARPLGWVGGYPFKNYVQGKVRVLVDTISTQGQCGAPEIVAAVTREKCSIGFVMPLEVEALLDHLSPGEVTRFRLKALITGGQPIKRSHVSRALQLAETVLVGYASNADKYEDFCAGKLVNNTVVKIIDDRDRECSRGEVGQILIKGPSVFSGFFNRQETPDPATSQIFTADGWFKTQDTGWVEDDGYLYVLGRMSDVISRDGIHLYPTWLETSIIQHDDVIEAVVLPVPDEVRYHKICVIVKTHADSAFNEMELENFCRSIFLANTRDNYVPMPDFFKVLKGADFPETITGKPNLHELRALAEKTFGAKS